MTSKSPIERQKNGRIECTVTFTTEQVAPAEERALKALAAEVKLPGFRPGQAPREMLMEKINKDHLLEETIRSLLPTAVEALVKEHEIKPIASPKVSLKKRDPLTISVVFVEHPRVTVKGADKIKVEKKEPKVDDKDVEKMVQYILEKHEHATETDRPAQEKDRVTLDFWGADAEGKEIPPIRTQGHSVTIGSSTLIPGFEEHLKGLKKGDEKSFTVTFPAKYHAKELENKPVTFHVTVKKVEEVTLPELTDAFVKEHLHGESTEAFQKDIRSSMIAQEEHIERQRREQVLLEEIRKATNVDLPQELIDDEEESLVENLAKELKRQNMTIQEWMEKANKKPDDVHKEMQDSAKKRLTLRLGIRELITSKNITVSDEEMKQTIDGLLSSAPPAERKNIEPSYQKGQQAYEQLEWQKKVEKLFEGMLA